MNKNPTKVTKNSSWLKPSRFELSNLQPLHSPRLGALTFASDPVELTSHPCSKGTATSKQCACSVHNIDTERRQQFKIDGYRTTRTGGRATVYVSIDCNKLSSFQWISKYFFLSDNGYSSDCCRAGQCYECRSSYRWLRPTISHALRKRHENLSASELATPIPRAVSLVCA